MGGIDDEGGLGNRVARLPPPILEPYQVGAALIGPALVDDAPSYERTRHGLIVHRFAGARIRMLGTSRPGAVIAGPINAAVSSYSTQEPTLPKRHVATERRKEFLAGHQLQIPGCIDQPKRLIAGVMSVVLGHDAVGPGHAHPLPGIHLRFLDETVISDQIAHRAEGDRRFEEPVLLGAVVDMPGPVVPGVHQVAAGVVETADLPVEVSKPARPEK